MKTRQSIHTLDDTNLWKKSATFPHLLFTLCSFWNKKQSILLYTQISWLGYPSYLESSFKKKKAVRLKQINQFVSAKLKSLCRKWIDPASETSRDEWWEVRDDGPCLAVQGTNKVRMSSFYKQTVWTAGDPCLNPEGGQRVKGSLWMEKWACSYSCHDNREATGLRQWQAQTGEEAFCDAKGKEGAESKSDKQRLSCLIQSDSYLWPQA